MSRLTVLRPDFSGDQILVLIRDTVTGVEHYRTVSDTLTAAMLDELEADDVAYIKQLRIEQDGAERERKER